MLATTAGAPLPAVDRPRWGRRRWRAWQLRTATAIDVMVPERDRWGHLGAGSAVVPPARVMHPEWIHLADDVVVHEDAFFAIVDWVPGARPRLTIGQGTRIGRSACFGIAAGMEIGAGVTIGDFALLVDTVHPYEVEERLAVVEPGAPVRIGDGAVLGSHVVVLPGVTIGEGARIEHHAVVGTDVEPGAVVVGHPAWRG